MPSVEPLASAKPYLLKPIKRYAPSSGYPYQRRRLSRKIYM